MKNQSFLFALLSILITTLQGCAIVGGIFKAGVGVGLFIAVVVIALIVYLISKMGKSK